MLAYACGQVFYTITREVIASKTNQLLNKTEHTHKNQMRAVEARSDFDSSFEKYISAHYQLFWSN